MNKKFFQSMSRILSILIMLVLVFSFTGASQAAMVVKSLKDLTMGADLIVQGAVVETASYWNAQRTNIYTEVTILVDDGIKGAETGDLLTLIVPGGTVDNFRQIVSDTPVFYEGLRSMLFLKKISGESISRMGFDDGYFMGPLYETHGRFQGKLEITNGKVNGMPLDEFKEEINHILFHGEKMPGSRLMETESSVLVGQSRYVYEDQRWEGDWPKVEYRIHNSFSTDQNTVIQNAATTWNNAGAKFTFRYGGTHSRSGESEKNGVNEVLWSRLASGTLGLATYYMVSSGGGPFYIVEADFSFNSDYNFSTSTPVISNDMESVALHEFGHWLSLGHSHISDAVMWYQLTTGTAQRTLHSDDIAGIQAIYGMASTPALPGEPSLISPSDNAVISGTSVNFRWQSTPDATKYWLRVLRSSDNQVMANQNVGNATSYTAGGFPNDGTKYRWAVAAGNTAGWGNYSASRVFTNGSALQTDPIGLYDPDKGVFYLKNDFSAGAADYTFRFGPAGSSWNPFMGDWNGNGSAGVGLYNPVTGVFYLKRTLSAGGADHTFRFGPLAKNWRPVSGDWNGDGTHDIGLYDPFNSTFYLKESFTAGAADHTFRFGPMGKGWRPVTGDWNGNGIHGIGLYDPSTGIFYLKNTLSSGIADYIFRFGPSGSSWIPISGDWNGNGKYGIGLYNGATGMLYLKDTISAGAADHTFRFGPAGSVWNSIN